MSEKTEADIIILGVGTCGEDLSLRLLGAGIEVIGIEADLIGGECPYWACIPSKVMIQAAEAVRTSRRASEIIGACGGKAHWAPVAKRLRWITGEWNDAVAVERYRRRGGTIIKGRGRLTGHRTVAVGKRTYTARRGIVIAVGSRPFIPPIAGIDDIDFWTTRDIMKLDTLPRSLIVLGGGVAIGGGEKLLKPALRVMKERLKLVPHPEVRLSSLGYDTALMGAIALAMLPDEDWY